MGGTAEKRDASVSRDERCIRCGYDLSGLPDEGACPECGLAVARSRDRSGLLRGADPRWLRLVARGLRDLELAMTILFGATVLLLVLIVAHQVALSVWQVRAPKIVEAVVDVSAVLVLLGVTVAHIRGCVLATLASHGDYSAPAWVRAVVRTCGILLPLSIGGVFVLRSELAAYSGPAKMVIRTAIEINAVAFFFALAALAEHYERRTVAWNTDLRRRHRQVRINLGILIALLVVNAWIYWIPVLGLLIAGVPALLLGAAYVLFASSVARVRAAVEMEHVIARELGVTMEGAVSPHATCGG